MNSQVLHQDLLTTANLVTRLRQCGAVIREIRLHGRAKPAVVLKRPPTNLGLQGIRYAWGVNQRGQRFERHACQLDGIQIQWEVFPKLDNVVPFPGRAVAGSAA